MASLTVTVTLPLTRQVGREYTMAAWVRLAPSVIAPLRCVFRGAHDLFLSLGLRHLVVVDEEHVPRGVITRKDLIDAR